MFSTKNTALLVQAHLKTKLSHTFVSWTLCDYVKGQQTRLKTSSSSIQNQFTFFKCLTIKSGRARYCIENRLSRFSLDYPGKMAFLLGFQESGMCAPGFEAVAEEHGSKRHVTGRGPSISFLLDYCSCHFPTSAFTLQ